jgi:leader peptidase (prepilin peptidase)/N-methyltransferase
MLYFHLIDGLILLSLSIVLGGLFGSFATALIYRLPRGIPIAFGEKASEGGDKNGAARSYCTHCKHQLSFLDLIPFLSYLFLHGRCRYCKESYGAGYFYVELSCIALALAVFLIFGITLHAAILIMAVPVILALFVIDLEHLILPDKLVGSLFVLGLGAKLLIPYMARELLLGDVAMAFVSVVSSGLIYAAVAWFIGFMFSKILKKDALGFGDVKFYAAAGVWLGVSMLPVFMMVSGVLGVLHGGYCRLAHKNPVFPFGPSLILSLVICYIFKDMFLLYFYE